MSNDESQTFLEVESALDLIVAGLMIRGMTLEAAAVEATSWLGKLVDETFQEGQADGFDTGFESGYEEGKNYALYGTGCGPDYWNCSCTNPYRKDEA